ncbi:MAG: AAA family ATPase, partial [Polyangiaceae bacterium]
MKISRLEIERFGHFTRRTFELGDAAEPTFFFGRNEAGKSTLLAFVRELLFGFQEKSRYDLGGTAEIAGNAHATLSNGETLSFRRRKGRKNTVSGVIGSPPRSFGEAELAAFVGQANASLFASVFAFGLAELEQGQKSLESAKLESALYGGALGGGRDVKAITEALDAQIGAIFNPKGRTQPVLETAARLRELNDQLRDASLRSVDYTAAVECARERNERVATLTIRIDALKKDLPFLDALAKGAPLVERRRRYAAELAEIGTSDDRRFVEHGAEIRLLENEARNIAELRAKLDTATAKNDAEREDLASAAKALDSTWDPARIVREAPNTATLSKLQELSRTRARLEERETAAKATFADAEKRHETATAVASAVGEAPTRELVSAKRARRDEGIALLGKADDLWVNRERKTWLAGDKMPFGEAVKKAVLDADAAVDALLARGSEDATRTAAHASAKRTAEDLERAKARLAEAQSTLVAFDREWPEKAGAFGPLAPPEACLLAQHVADLAGKTRLADERRVQIEAGRKRVATHAERVDRLAKMLLEEPLVEGTSAISVLLKHVERADRAARAINELDQLDRQIADLAPTTDDLAGWTA